MTCINYKNKQYQNLLAETGLSKTSLNAKILKFQADNKTDKYPSATEILGGGQSVVTAVDHNTDTYKKLLVTTRYSKTKLDLVISKWRAESGNITGFPSNDVAKDIGNALQNLTKKQPMRDGWRYDDLALRELHEHTYQILHQFGLNKVSVANSIIKKGYIVMTPEMVDKVNRYFSRVPKDKRNFQDFGKSKNGFELLDNSHVTMVYKQERDGNYLYFSIKESQEIEPGFNAPVIVYRGRLKVDLVYKQQEGSYVKGVEKGMTYEEWLVSRVSKELIKPRATSAKKIANARYQTIVNTIQKLVNTTDQSVSRNDVITGTDTFLDALEDVKRSTLEKLQKLAKSLIPTVTPDELRKAWVKTVMQKNVDKATRVYTFWDSVFRAHEDPDSFHVRVLTKEQEANIARVFDALPDDMIKLISYDFIAGYDNAFFMGDNRPVIQRLVDKISRDISNVYAQESGRGDVVSLAAKLALADGVITQKHVDAANKLIYPIMEQYVKAQVSLTPTGRRELKKQYYQKLPVLRQLLRNNAELARLKQSGVDFSMSDVTLAREFLKIISQQSESKRSYIRDAATAVDDELSIRDHTGLFAMFAKAFDAVMRYNYIFTNVNNASFTEEFLLKAPSRGLEADPVAVALHEFGHAVDMYVATVNPKKRAAIVNFLEDIVAITESPDSLLAKNSDGFFKKYLVHGLQSRGYRVQNKREIIADLFATVIAKSAGIDLSKSHLRTMGEFLEDHEQVLDELAVKYFKEFDPIVETFTETNELPLWKKFFLDLMLKLGSFVDSLMGNTYFRPMLERAFRNSLNNTMTGITPRSFNEIIYELIHDSDNYNIDKIVNSNEQASFFKADRIFDSGFDGFMNPNATSSRSSDTADFKRVFDEQKRKIEFIPNGHKYVETTTGQSYTPVSDVSKMTGYNEDYTGSTTMRSTLAAPIGTGIHTLVNEYLTGRKLPDSEHFPITEDCKKELHKILGRLLPEGTEVLGVEQVLSHDLKRYAGTLDLIVKLRDGTVRLLDFKTKITKASFLDAKSKNPWLKYEAIPFNKDSRTIGKSQKLKHDFQQTMYTRMLEEMGLQVDEKGIVPLEIYLTEDKTVPGEYKIHGMSITGALKGVSNDKDTGIGFYRLKNDLRVTNDVNVALGLSSATEADLIKMEELETLQEICNKALDVLKHRSARYRTLGKVVKGEILEKNILTMESFDNADMLMQIVKSAFDELKPLVKSYNELVAKETDGDFVNWNLKILLSWYDYANAFDVLTDIRVFMEQYPTALSHLSNDERDEFGRLLDEAIVNRDKLMSALYLKGRPVWEKWIASYSDATEALFRRRAELEFKKDKWDTALSTARNEEEMGLYIEKYMKDNEALIRDAKAKFIKQNANTCFQDVNGFVKYVSSIFDTKDPVIGSMGKAYYERMIDYRQIVVDWYHRLEKLTSEFEKSYLKSSFSDTKKAYDYMLDYSGDGAKLVTKRSAAFEKSYTQAKSNIWADETLTPQQQFKDINTWVNKHAPVKNNTKLEKEIRDYYRKLLADHAINDEEYNALVDYENDQRYSISKLGRDGTIRSDVIDNIIQSRDEIIWDNREIDKKLFPNDKYDALMKMNKTDVRYRMYDFFVKMSNRGDAGVANRFKLNGYLPGVSKSFAERIVAGQGVVKSAATEVKHALSGLRPDDTGYGQYELASEDNQAVDFVPIYFTSQLEDAEQSYDLPTIYKEWFKSALNYEMITDLLPMMEFTRRVVRDRKVLKKNSKGHPVKNLLGKVWSDRNPDSQTVDDYEEATTNHIADMLNAWFKQVVYDKADDLDVTHSKIVKALSKFTSLKIMGLNLMSMINNSAVAEVNQAIEVAAGSVMSKGSYTRATKEYMFDLGNTLGDVGSRRATGKTNLLCEYFGVFQEYDEGKMRDRSISKRLFYTSTLYVTTTLGEHLAQSRFMLGMLIEKRANSAEDGSGEDLGSVFDNITVEDGKLVFNPKMKNFGKKEQMKLRRQLNSLLRGMHGNYLHFSKVMIQQNGYGALALQFRKWIVPGLERRWRKEYYDEFASMYKEGYYRSGGRYRINQVKKAYWGVAKFFGQLADEATMLDLIAKTDFKRLTKEQQEGIRRLNTEIGIFVAATLILMAVSGLKGDDDDDKRYKRSAAYRDDGNFGDFALNHFLYQMYRLRTEQLFYISPVDFVKIVKSPIAATSSLTDLAQLLEQSLPWHITETYRSGRHKGRNKAFIMALKRVPITRQYLRWLDPVGQKKSLDMI
jgi:hypothetical protein